MIYELSELFAERGAPDYLRTDNGPEFTAESVREWLRRPGVKTLFTDPGSPWENGYIESVNGKMRDELLNGEILDSILEAKVITERRRKTYNTVRPPSPMGYRPLAPKVRHTLGLPMAEQINTFNIGSNAGGWSTTPPFPQLQVFNPHQSSRRHLQNQFAFGGRRVLQGQALQKS